MCSYVAFFSFVEYMLQHAGSTEAAGAACSSWTTLYSQKEQITLAPGNLLTILPVRPKEWQVKFELQPTSIDYDIECGMCNILHMTNFCHRGSKLGCVGSQIPRFYYDPSKDMKLTMVTASNGDGSDYGGSYKMSKWRHKNEVKIGKTLFWQTWNLTFWQETFVVLFSR